MGHGTVNYSRRDKRLIGADRDVAEKAENSIAKLDCRNTIPALLIFYTAFPMIFPNKFSKLFSSFYQR